MRDNGSCYEFMKKYKDPKVNCKTCVKRTSCREEKSYEDTPNFADFKHMMEDAKDIRLEA